MKITWYYLDRDRESALNWLKDSLPLRLCCARNGAGRYEPHEKRPGWWICSNCTRETPVRDVYCYPLLGDREDREAVNGQLRTTRERHAPDYDERLRVDYKEITDLLRERGAEHGV